MVNCGLYYVIPLIEIHLTIHPFPFLGLHPLRISYRKQSVRPSTKPFRQRIIISYDFGGLQEAEAVDYLRNRFALAGASPSIMDDNAMLSAYSSSGGSIRKLNLIVTKSLMIGTQHNKQTIDTDIILAAVNEIELV